MAGRTVRLSAAVRLQEDRLRKVIVAANAKRGRHTNPVDYEAHVASLERLSNDPLMPAWRREELAAQVKIHRQLADAVQFVGEETFMKDPSGVIRLVAALR